MCRLRKQTGDSGLHLYHTPALPSPWHRLIPSPFNEVVGLTHLKVYLWDDEVIISGCVAVTNDIVASRV